MKKLFALALVVFGLAACQTEPEGLDVNVGGEVDTTITVSLPETTRATDSAEGAFVNVNLDGDATIRYILQVYYNGEPSDERLVKYSDGKSVAFDVRLVSGRKYQFVAWADYVESEADVDKHYDTSDLENIKLNGDWNAMDETRDAFTATQEVTYSSTATIDLTLTRPFAKLRVKTTDMEALNNIDIKPTKATVEYATPYRASFNALEGKAVAAVDSNVKSHGMFEIATYDDNTNASKVLFTDYFFAENDVVKFNLTVYDQNDVVINKTIVFNTDINVKRNHLTTIAGNILTDGKNVNVKVEDAFDSQYSDVETTESFSKALKEADESVEATIDLSSDVVWVTGAGHGSTPWIPEGANTKKLTVNANGHKITATGAGVGAIRMANGGELVINNAVIVDESVSYNEGAWELGYLEFGGNLAFNNCTFVNAIQLEEATATFNKCSFNSNKTKEYAVWVCGNKAYFNECTFEGPRGIKIHEAYGSEVEEVIIDNCLFNGISEKPGVAMGDLNADTTVEIKNSTFINCQAGDQSLYIYETDTDVTTFDFTEKDNSVMIPVTNAEGAVVEGVSMSVDETTYAVTSLNGLEWVAASVNDKAGFGGKTVKLAKDIDCFNGYMSDGDPVTTAPIGDKKVCGTNVAFKGTFDGQGHSIKNLYQNGWTLNYEWGVYGSLGLFRELENATVKNVVIEGMDALVEGGDISFIAGSATGDCVFENITIKDSSIGTYNNGCGGIIGWSGAGNYTFKDITIGEDVVLGGLWGSFDSSIGGIVGQAEPGATYNFENVTINCRIDAYNDCTASYDYYNYRMCGMIIGRCEETTTIDGKNYPDLSKYNLSFNNVVVNYGDWMNYHYCRRSGERAVRIEPGYAYGGAENRDHSGDNAHCKEWIPFNQLIGGDQYAVKGLPAVDGVTVNYPESFYLEQGYKAVGNTYTVYSGKGFKEVATGVLNDGSKNVTIELANDIDLAGIEWPAVSTKAAFVLDGKGYAIKNLTTSAVEDHGFYSTAMFTSTRKATTIKNLVVENATVTGKGGDNSHGAVLVACNYAALNIEGVTVKNSTVSNCDRSSVITTYLYFTTATVKNCVVEGCTVNSIGTAGALLGMNNSHDFEATGNTVKNTTISSSEGSNKAGILIGTWQDAGNLTESNNVVENSKAINAGTETNNNIGRHA